MQNILKRIFDIIVASTLLFLLSPFLIIIAWIIRLDGGKAIFKQDRVGKDGKHFTCYKFRTMEVGAEEALENNEQAKQKWQELQKIPNDERVTKFGKLLRCGIDELPQLFNVLKGDMSLVGPRPILPTQKHFYGDDFTHYVSIRPGITGIWQVSGRNKLSIIERAKLEGEYARTWNLYKDFIILLKTPLAILKGEQSNL